MDHSFMHSSCVFYPRWWRFFFFFLGPHATTGCTHLICPAGTNAPLSYCEAPCEPKGMLLFSSVFFIYFYFPYTWQILNQKCLGNSTLRSFWQSTCEVNLIDRKRKPGGRGGEAKSMNEKLTRCPWLSVPSTNQHVFQAVVSLSCLRYLLLYVQISCNIKTTWSSAGKLWVSLDSGMIWGTRWPGLQPARHKTIPCQALQDALGGLLSNVLRGQSTYSSMRGTC